MVHFKLNEKLKGIELYFNTKPTEDTRNSLRAHGWRWHREKHCWYAKHTDKNLEFAKSFCENKYLEAPVQNSIGRDKMLSNIELLLGIVNEGIVDENLKCKPAYNTYTLEELETLQDDLLSTLNKRSEERKKQIEKRFPASYRDRIRYFGLIKKIDESKCNLIDALSERWYKAHPEYDEQYNFNTFDNDCDEVKDQKRSCVDCGATFFLDKSEVEFFLSRGLHLPQRCLDCRESSQILHITDNAHTLENSIYHSGDMYLLYRVGVEKRYLPHFSSVDVLYHCPNRDRYFPFGSSDSDYEMEKWIRSIVTEMARKNIEKLETEVNLGEKYTLLFYLAVYYSILGDEEKEDYYIKKYLGL